MRIILSFFHKNSSTIVNCVVTAIFVQKKTLTNPFLHNQFLCNEIPYCCKWFFLPLSSEVGIETHSCHNIWVCTRSAANSQCHFNYGPSLDSVLDPHMSDCIRIKTNIEVNGWTPVPLIGYLSHKLTKNEEPYFSWRSSIFCLVVFVFVSSFQ